MSISKSKKNIVITGASSGIGEALALHYAQGRHHLILTGQNESRLSKVVEMCEAKGATVKSKIIDVCAREKLHTWLEEMDQITPVDLVIANAGISGGTEGTEGTDFMAQMRQIYDVNVMGVLNTLEPIINAMIKRKSGQVAFMSSMASYAPWPGAPAYASSKTAMRYLGHSLRGSLKQYGIKVSVICPGFIESRITAKNNFPMPFFKKADYAAVKIAKGLEKNKVTIAFPFPVYAFSVLIGCLPSAILIYMNSKLPSKGAL